MFFPVILSLLAFLHLILAAPTCTTLSIPVSVTARNAHFPPDFTTNSLLSIIGALGAVVFDSLITDTYMIVGTYCEPEVLVENRRDTVQLLVHGATYTRAYWRGDDFEERYSWVDASSKEGYPTLAIDRLGNGDSSHPDPILAVQYPVEVETIHQIILKFRAGTLSSPLAGRKFNKIIYVGHSYASIIGNALATLYPTDLTSLILTGWSSTFITLIPTVLGTAVILPASLILTNPKYKSLPLGYLSIASLPGFRALFFSSPSTYNASLFTYDFNNRGTITAGEAVTLGFGVNTASAYEGSVLVATGQHDAIFCNELGINILLGGLLGESECGDARTGYLGRSKELFPRARVFDGVVVPDAGHCWQLHYSAEKGFAMVNEWLQRQGF